jgi:hypothetical protein
MLPDLGADDAATGQFEDRSGPTGDCGRCAGSDEADGKDQQDHRECCADFL